MSEGRCVDRAEYSPTRLHDRLALRRWLSMPPMARCVCGVEGRHAADACRDRRNDPYDPATARHLGQCEFVHETDAARLRVLRKVTDKGQL